MPRASLAQAEEDLAAAHQRVEETYYEWACQLAREAASDALALVEDELGRDPPPEGEIGVLADRLEGLGGRVAFAGRLAEAASTLDEVLDPTLEPDHEPSLARREGGSTDYLVAEDAREALEAARAIVDACRGFLQGTG